MNDASDPSSVPTTACPNCGTVQPQARRCKDCGAPLPWTRPALKGRERALESARRGGARWPVWVAGGSVVLLVGALAAVQLGGFPRSEPSPAALAAEAAGTDPELQSILAEDPNALAQARRVLDEARELGLPHDERLFRVRSQLRELQAARDHARAIVARANRAPDLTPNPTPDPAQASSQVPNQIPPANPIAATGAESDTANSVSLGPVGAAVGLPRLQTRKCYGTGEDKECIEIFEDPAAISAAAKGAGAASPLKNAETLRRKAQESAEILKGL